MMLILTYYEFRNYTNRKITKVLHGKLTNRINQWKQIHRYQSNNIYKNIEDGFPDYFELSKMGIRHYIPTMNNEIKCILLFMYLFIFNFTEYFLGRADNTHLGFVPKTRIRKYSRSSKVAQTLIELNSKTKITLKQYLIT